MRITLVEVLDKLRVGLFIFLKFGARLRQVRREVVRNRFLAEELVADAWFAEGNLDSVRKPGGHGPRNRVCVAGVGLTF